MHRYGVVDGKKFSELLASKHKNKQTDHGLCELFLFVQFH